MTKKYYWLKLKDTFFESKEIKKLRKVAGGDTFTIIYLKMMLKSVKTEGKLFFENIEDDFASEIALDIDEETENVKMTLGYLQRYNLIEIIEEDYLLKYAVENIGNETDAAERMRRMREKKEVINENVTKLHENVTKLLPVTKCYTEIEKDIKIEYIEQNSNSFIQTFEELWKLYPNKKGKDKIKTKDFKTLEKIGYETLKTCIERYIREKEKYPWKEWQHGSTFFKGGYIDYLDDNYVVEKEKKQEKRQLASEYIIED